MMQAMTVIATWFAVFVLIVLSVSCFVLAQEMWRYEREKRKPLA
jgi:hypothetical protein